MYFKIFMEFEIIKILQISDRPERTFGFNNQEPLIKGVNVSEKSQLRTINNKFGKRKKN